MKALILAGGHGVRLNPLTKAVNKHLLPVYDKPMIMYGIERLREAGIKEIFVSLDSFNPFGFMSLLKGEKLAFLVQEGAKGIAHAIYEARKWIGKEPFIVYLGDNIFCSSLKFYVEKFRRDPVTPRVLLKRIRIDKARNYGVAQFEERKLIKFVEKPEIPPSRYILLGIYFLTSEVFRVFPRLKLSQRGEYEITDLLNRLFPISHDVYSGLWWDCGTVEDIYDAALYFRGRKK